MIQLKHLYIQNVFKTICAGICMVALAACSGDDSGPDGLGGCANNFNWLNAVSDEISALTAAATAYSSDQSTANCDAYQAAAVDYLDALEDALDCVSGADRAELESALDDARADVDEGICN